MSNQLKRTVDQYLILSAGMSQEFDRFGFERHLEGRCGISGPPLAADAKVRVEVRRLGPCVDLPDRTLWAAIAWTAAINGVFRMGASPLPLLPSAILLPVIVGAPLLLLSKQVGQLLDSIPTTWLVALQLYRVWQPMARLLAAWAAARPSDAVLWGTIPRRSRAGGSPRSKKGAW